MIMIHRPRWARPPRRPDDMALGAAERAVPGHSNRVGRIVGWWRCDRGVAAVEFALLAPILAFMLLAGVDLGLAVSERMAVDHALRAGAQEAMNDPGEPRVLELMRKAAESNFALDDGSGTQSTPLALSVTRFCACPDNVGFAVTCSTICPGSKPTFIYYRMAGEKSYRGWIMPVFGFAPSVQVQIR